MRFHMFIIVLVFLFAGTVAGCSSSSDVQGIGSGTDQYKKSPCACGDVIPMKAGRRGADVIG